jgi:hypothetical protein
VPGPARVDRGVVDQDVGATERLLGTGGDRLDRRRVRDVGVHPERLAALDLDRGTVACSASGCRSTASTRAPRAASSRAVAAPIPVAAPVTIAFLPATDTGRILRAGTPRPFRLDPRPR